MRNDIDRPEGISTGMIVAIVAALLLAASLFIWGPWSSNSTANNTAPGTTVGSGSTTNPAAPATPRTTGTPVAPAGTTR